MRDDMKREYKRLRSGLTSRGLCRCCYYGKKDKRLMTRIARKRADRAWRDPGATSGTAS